MFFLYGGLCDERMSQDYFKFSLGSVLCLGVLCSFAIVGGSEMAAIKFVGDYVLFPLSLVAFFLYGCF